jgi:hypothetical protein
MSTANFGFEMQYQGQAQTSAGLTASVIPIAMDRNGYVVLGYTAITAVATLTALTTPKFAHRAVVFCVSSDAANSVAQMFNTGTTAAPVFTGLVS